MNNEQRELFLFIVNDGALYRQQGAPIIVNLQKKFRKGVFDQAKAVKLYRYLADNGAKKYTFEFGDKKNASNWNQVPGYGVFSVADRNAVAQELTKHYLEEITSKQNPARRGKRPSIRLSAYVTRPSQITKKKPSNRLVRRRRKVVASPRKGYFPNPLHVLRLQKKAGRIWRTFDKRPYSAENVTEMKELARKLAVQWNVRVRLVAS